MRGLLTWKLHRDRGIALFILVALLLAAYSGFNLDRLTALLYLAGLSQGALWGGLALLFVLYRREVRAAGRGETGLLLLLPAGPLRFTLAQAIEFLVLGLFLFAGLVLLAAWGAGRFYPQAPGDLVRLGFYLFLTLGLPALGLAQLMAATHIAYRLGRVGGVMAAAVALGLPAGAGWILARLDGPSFWNWGPQVALGRFDWLTGGVPGLAFAAPPGAWPAWPPALGLLVYLVVLALVSAIYREAEL